MQIAVVTPTPEGPRDLLVDCDDATSVSDLESAIVAVLGQPVAMPGSADSLASEVLENGVLLDGGESARRCRIGARLQLHVVGGPAAGVVWDLSDGRHDIGRAGTIRWRDPRMSRRHAALVVCRGAVDITDLGSRSGTRIGASPCPAGESTPWAIGQMVEIGASLVVLRESRTDEALDEASDRGWRRFRRPPRIRPLRAPPTVAFPRPPTASARPRFPLIALLLPAVFGVAVAIALHRRECLLFALASPLMAVAHYLSARLGAAKDTRRAIAAHDAAYAIALERWTEIVEDEQRRLRDEQPDPAATLLEAVRPGRRLWERRRADADFLSIRIGSADQEAVVEVTGPAPDARGVRRVPRSVNLGDVGVLGIAGAEDDTDGVLRWVIGQLAAHRSPHDLALVFLGATAGPEWSWLHWLPHLRPPSGDDCLAMIGSDADTIVARVEHLRRVVRERQGQCSVDPQMRERLPVVVMIVRDYRPLHDLTDLHTIIEDGPAVSVFVVATADTEVALPESTSVLVAIPPGSIGQAFVSGPDLDARATLVDQVSVGWAQRFARGLAPYRGVRRDESALPDQVRLLDVLDLDHPTPEAVRERWRTCARSTTAVLGVGADGPLLLDLTKEGPHLLIAGMTGSGKSELLQTLIASLALANRPDWLSFVLIDYKGDSAFKDCARLPHAVGKVNDLNPFLVERALASLDAELDLRKRLLADSGAKDIDDYHRRLIDEPGRSPLPRLVLVIDEFAELAKELPDFIAGLISISQLGRSLGVHLVLATQRPGGVVSPAIRANANARIALRVADAADSTDVVGLPDAARISSELPGRGYLRGSAQQVIEFQTASVGRTASRGRRDRRAPSVTLLDWERIGRPAPTPPPHSEGASASTDLAELVRCLRAAARAEGVPPQRQPWCDPLPEHLAWSDAGLPRTDLPPLPFGRADDPARQRQSTSAFDLEHDGHLYVVGAARSGRSQVLRVLAGSIAELASPADVHLYGIDCDAGALSVLTSMPHCGAVVGRAETIRAGRLLARLAAELDRRQQTLSAARCGDIAEQRRASDHPLPHIVLMLDRWEGFVASPGDIDGLTEIVLRLLREGFSAGIHLIVTGDRSLITNPRLSALADRKLVLRLTDRQDYVLAGLRGGRIPDHLPAGRGFGAHGLETQVFLLDDDPSGRAQGAMVRRLGELATQRVAGCEGPRPFRLDALPARVTVADALALLPPNPARPMPVVAIGGDELQSFSPDSERSCFVIAGPSRSGRSTVLCGAVETALATGATAVLLAPRPSPLRDLAARDGVLGVFGEQMTAPVVDAALRRSAARPTILVIDDADDLHDASLEPFLHRAVQGLIPDLRVIIAGSTDGLGAGFGGWLAQARKARSGLLLSPQRPGDGDLIGVRLPRESVGGVVRPGSGLLHLGDGSLLTVATLAPNAEGHAG